MAGPSLFRQQRVGRNGKPFEVLKFRTMIVNAEGRKNELASMNLHAVGDTPGMFKVANDPRTTRFGAWLRRWSIHELPQLVNVLRGDMSLVGPRPLIPEEARLVQGHHEVRLTARPGITGPWQTLGRSDIGFEDMIKLDYAYVMNPSFAEDMKLLMRTVTRSSPSGARTQPPPLPRRRIAEMSSESQDFVAVYDEHVWDVYGFLGYRLSSRRGGRGPCPGHLRACAAGSGTASIPSGPAPAPGC